MLRVENVVKHFIARGGVVRAVNGVNLDVSRGEALSLVGETGSGKTTLARCITMLTSVTSGRIMFDDIDVTRVSQQDARALRRRMQIIFQDPYGSLNPRHTVGYIIGEPFEIHGLATGDERTRRVRELMELVGLNPDDARRYPHEFSGGQRQRINIARAIALRPEFIVCDEPVSALDVSIRAQILNLLADLRQQFGLTYLFISHDLAVVRHVSDRVAVMRNGEIVETAATETLFTAPQHEYTRALIDAIPIPDPDAADARAKAAILQVAR
ncbi:MAG TPA: ATP-binding cassette domain-containing protein [Gemmatimonadaceae bacterium]|nr:ATP-binding cassette domain-containing protein [Gemmatimonadaceae bacterium]